MSVDGGVIAVVFVPSTGAVVQPANAIAAASAANASLVRSILSPPLPVFRVFAAETKPKPIKLRCRFAANSRSARNPFLRDHKGSAGKPEIGACDAVTAAVLCSIERLVGIAEHLLEAASFRGWK